MQITVFQAEVCPPGYIYSGVSDTKINNILQYTERGVTILRFIKEQTRWFFSV